LDCFFVKGSMTEKIHLWPEEIIASGDSITIGAILERLGGKRQHLWYRLPIAYREAVTKSCDPFVLGLLFTIMKSPVDLHVHGEVSPSLLRNLVEFQDAWACWRPAKYHRIEISADVEREQPRAKTNQAIMGFSGGGDSTYTVWRHRTGRAGRQQHNLVAGVMLHGFDIPLEEAEVFARAAENARIMLASLGMELIPIATNFREIGGTWEDAFAAGLASCLALLQGRYNTGLIASGNDYSTLIFPWGSNPLTDGLMSSDSFQVIHDGASLDKMAKIKQFSVWPEALKYLRVCFNGHYARNCCRCAKCMKIILLFRILGMGLPECFERDISDGDILRLRWKMAEIKSMEYLVKQARDASISASWVRALQFSMMINRLRLSAMQVAPLRKVMRRVYRFFLPPFQ
jgi:hypothetical protein